MMLSAAKEKRQHGSMQVPYSYCLLYTSDAADE